MSLTKTSTNQVFSWVFNDDDDPKNTSKYEFAVGNKTKLLYIKRLKTCDPESIISHAVHFLTKMDDFGFKNCKYHFTLFPRTLAPVLKNSWKTQADAVPADAPPNDFLFQTTLKNFISDHVTDQTRADALEQLRNCKKPRTMTVRNFRYRIEEIRSLIKWIPGNMPN